MKRFYETVAVVVTDDDDQFRVTLDGRPVRSPMRRLLVLPCRHLADAIADEWRRQDEELSPADMPMTGLANAAVDQVGPRRAEIVDKLAAYAETDLLCYHADRPADLVDRQRDAWLPLLDWAAQRYDALLHVVTGVTPQPQPAEAVAALKAAVAAYDDFRLSALMSATGALGSLILALALAEGRLSGESAWQASQVDEGYQRDRWGDDPEAAARRSGQQVEVLAAARFLSLLAAPTS